MRKMSELFYQFFSASRMSPSDSQATFLSVSHQRFMADHKGLSEQDIIRRLRLLRHDPQNRADSRGGRKIPLRWVAEMAGLDRATLYRAIWSGRISEKSRAALSPVLIMLQTDQ
jgi:hypothetical protein